MPGGIILPQAAVGDSTERPADDQEGVWDKLSA
jgi:hypothetical protein